MRNMREAVQVQPQLEGAHYEDSPGRKAAGSTSREPTIPVRDMWPGLCKIRQFAKARQSSRG